MSFALICFVTFLGDLASLVLSFWRVTVIPEVEKMMRTNVFSKENYQQGCIGGGFLFLVCEVILMDRNKKPELGLCQKPRGTRPVLSSVYNSTSHESFSMLSNTLQALDEC